MKTPTPPSINSLKKIAPFIKTHKTISILCVLAISFGTYYFYTKKSTTLAAATYSIAEVKEGSISNTVNGSGQIIPVNTLDLKTKTSGDIREVLVKAGDTVTQGQPLVKLNASQALQKVRTAEVNLESAKLDLERLKKPAETLDVIQVKNAIAKAESDIKTQDTLVANAKRNLLNASYEAVSKITNSTDVPPTITGQYLGDKEGEIVISPYGSGDGAVFMLSGLSTGTGFINTVTAQPLGNTGLYIKFSNAVSQGDWVINLPNKKASNYLSLSTTYQNALDTRERTVADLERGIIENKLKLEKLEKGADSIDIESKELVIRQRENDLAQARSDYLDSIVTAPFDGIVATLHADIGTTVTSGVSLGTIITDKKVAKISLNEVDAAKLSIGQKAVLTFDAIDGLRATSSIAEIDTLGTETQGVVTYDVKLLFSSTDTRVKPGMSISVDITSEKKEKALLLPLLAVTTDNNGSYVERLTEKMTISSSTRSMSQKPSVSKVPVVLGISNDRQVEIVSGLSSTDQVLITRKSTGAKTSAANAPTATSILSGGGARRPGGF